MKGEIFIIIFLYLLVFIFSSIQPKENEQIDLSDFKSQLFRFNDENDKTDNNKTNNGGKDDDEDDDDDDKKTLIICLSIGSAIVVIVIVVIFLLFIRSKLTYDKLNEKINKISFSEERDNNRETKTEDLE